MTRRMHHILRGSALLLALIVGLAACGLPGRQTAALPATETADPATLQLAADAETAVPALGDLIGYDPADTDAAFDPAACIRVTFEGGAAAVEGEGAAFADGVLTVSAAGDYLLSGSLEGGVTVNASKDSLVRLILNGVSVQSADGPALQILQCDKTVIVLPAGSDNRLTDSETYTLAEGTDEPDAALYAKDDLTVTGTGSLTVTGRYADGIKGKDDLLLLGGTLTVEAADDGVTGRDRLVLDGAALTVTAAGDGLKTTNEADGKGLLIVNDGSAGITAGGDGLDAAAKLYLLGGTLTVTAGGGAGSASTVRADDFGRGRFGGQIAAAADDSPSQKGLKAAVQLTVAGGDVTVSAADDALHTNGHLLMTGGTVTAASGDDGVHADGSLTMAGGSLTVSQSYEGLEAAQITLAGGAARVTASDDGLNATDGNGQDLAGGMARGGNTATADTVWIRITGGWLWVDAGGDGLDSNSSLTMTGGTVCINGPTNSGNGALDCAGGMEIYGGTLVAVGSLGMAEGPSAGSTQAVLTYGWSEAQAADTLLSLTDADGEVLAAFRPAKTYQWLAVSTPAMHTGQTVTLQTGGNSAGAATDGWYGAAAVQGASAVERVELTSTVTAAGNAQGMGGMGGMGGRQGFGWQGGFDRGGTPESGADSNVEDPGELPGDFGGGFPGGQGGMTPPDGETPSELPGDFGGGFPGGQGGMTPPDGETPSELPGDFGGGFPGGQGGMTPPDGERPTLPGQEGSAPNGQTDQAGTADSSRTRGSGRVERSGRGSTDGTSSAPASSAAPSA